jgi:hypothetical protein
MPNPTTDQLRDDIDKGRTGEKISMPDPATVPLGTDAEAGGSPPTPQERKLEAASQTRAPKGEGGALPGGMIYLILVLFLAVALVAIVMLAAR